jgi:hypothetical protein
VRTLALFAVGVLYGALVAHLHDGHAGAGAGLGSLRERLAGVAASALQPPDARSAAYLAAWGAAGVLMGSLLPWVDGCWRGSGTVREARGAAWQDVVRSVGAFVGIAFAIVSFLRFSISRRDVLMQTAPPPLGNHAAALADAGPDQPVPVVPRRRDRGGARSKLGHRLRRLRHDPCRQPGPDPRADDDLPARRGRQGRCRQRDGIGRGPGGDAFGDARRCDVASQRAVLQLRVLWERWEADCREAAAERVSVIGLRLLGFVSDFPAATYCKSTSRLVGRRVCNWALVMLLGRRLIPLRYQNRVLIFISWSKMSHT